MKRKLFLVMAGVLVIGALGGMIAFMRHWGNGPEQATPDAGNGDRDRNRNTYTVTKTDYHRAALAKEIKLTNDQVADKKPTFDPALVHGLPIAGWDINLSQTLFKMDCPEVRPDGYRGYLVLHPNYQAALKNTNGHVLPSANMLDGLGKQFDDGLYAALELACFKGDLGIAPSAPQVIAKIFSKLPKDSKSRAYLAAALELADDPVSSLSAQQEAAKKTLVAGFENNEERSKPISFYTWTPELGRVWKFFRFLQAPLQRNVATDMVQVVQNDASLRAEYDAINAFYFRLTNPPSGAWKSLSQGLPTKPEQSIGVFPPGTSREAELFNSMFQDGLPAGVNLMTELIYRIRSGEVDLAPKKSSGWYQHQVYALETMLLPKRGAENEKLVLSARYKRRLIDAFKATMTKRRETHVRHLSMAGSKSAERPRDIEKGGIKLRWRLEPMPTFYLRTARAYAFLANFLTSTVGQKNFAELKGLRKGGHRELDLATELNRTRRMFYGFYLLSCEDIGLKPALLEDEPVIPVSAMKLAKEVLASLAENPDLACDTRVSVPIFRDLMGGKTRMWATLGVRVLPLQASFASLPKIRPHGQDVDWEDAKWLQLEGQTYEIMVDEFAEFELPGSSSLTRDELRAICDKYKTKEEILKALRRQ